MTQSTMIKKPHRKKRGQIKHLLGHVAVTLLILVTGGVGSIYSREIRNTFPFHFHERVPTSVKAAIFWSLAIVTAALYGWQQLKGLNSDDKAQRRLISRAKSLERLLRTMPPENFLAVFNQMYLLCDSARKFAYQPVVPTEDLDHLEGRVRAILRNIAILAQNYDGNHPNVKFAANIMIYRDRSEFIGDEQKTDLTRRLRFCDDGVTIEGLRGVLDLDINMSTIALDENALPDATLRPLALPVPVIVKDNRGKYNALPGAPAAFVNRKPEIYANADDIEIWCKDHGNLKHDVVSAISTYFRNESSIKSFISIPLFRNDKAGGEEEPMGILNIHCDSQKLLKMHRQDGQDGPISNFVAVMAPFILILADLVTTVLTLRSSGATADHPIVRNSELSGQGAA